jgi:large subunit ribosomal protein L25
MLKKGRFKSTLFNMKVEGHEDVRVICRDVQRHVVKDLPTHVDFLRLRRTTKINLFINVEVTGEEESPGLKKGGVLTLIRPEVELVVTAADIPESITIDVSGLDIGDSATISSVDLPAGVKPTIDRDFVIAQISAPSGLASQSDDEEEDVEADEVPTTEMGPPDGEES